MSKEEPQVEWSLGMMRTLVYYTASSTWETIATLQRGKHMARIMPSTRNFGSKSSKCAFQKFKITHPPHPGRLLQYTIPTGMLRALAVLQCRAKEQSTASNGDWGVHVRVSTTVRKALFVPLVTISSALFLTVLVFPLCHLLACSCLCACPCLVDDSRILLSALGSTASGCFLLPTLYWYEKIKG